MESKKLKGYFTIEATCIMPMVLFFFILIIIGGIYLYDTCVMSQDGYLLVYRGSRMTDASENHVEVIYGNRYCSEFTSEYIKERWNRKVKTYPCYSEQGAKIEVNEKEAAIKIIGFNGALRVEKRLGRINPVEVIRNMRR